VLSIEEAMLSFCVLCELLVAKSDVARAGSADKVGGSDGSSTGILEIIYVRYRDFLNVIAVCVSRIAGSFTL